MKWLRLLRLRTRLAFGMMAFVIAGFVVIYAGSLLNEVRIADQVFQGLSAPAKRAWQASMENRLGERNDMQALLDEAPAYRMRIDLEYKLGLGILLGVAVVAGGFIAVRFAGRMVRPIERVAEAAGRVAQGDLRARAATDRVGSREVGELVANFNQMAETLEATDRELKETTAAIAHELRTPLTILRGRLQGMHDGVFASGAAEIRGLIMQVESLSHVVNDLQVVSLAEASKLTLNLQPLDLAAEVEALLPTVEPDFEAIAMAVELDLRPALVSADPVRLRQLLVALLHNARRYAVSGRVIRIETARMGEQVVLRVLDRGPGFPDGSEGLVFDRFWRAEESRSRQTGGSGLGLSVVKAIASAHGGQASASKRSGGGAVIEIALPGLLPGHFGAPN